MNNARGITLVETMAVIVILAMIAGTVYPLLNTSTLLLARHRELEEVIENNRIALRRLVREVRYATAVYNTGNASIEAGHLEFGTQYLLDSDDGEERLHYGVEDGQILQETDLGSGYGTPVPIAEKIGSLVTSYDSDTGTVQFTLETSYNGKTWSMQSRAKVRTP